MSQEQTIKKPHWSLKKTTVLTGHTDRVWCVRWAPSGKALASCSGDHTIRIWTTEPSTAAASSERAEITFKCKAILEQSHTRSIRSVTWSPDGSLLASAGFDGLVCVYKWSREEETFQLIASLEGHENEVKSVSFNSDGSLLASCSRDKSVWIWSLTDRDRLKKMATDDPDFECISVCTGHTQDVKMVSFSPVADVS